MVKRNETKPEAKKLKDKDVKKNRNYICPGQDSYGFYIPVRNENGKKVQARDGRGNLKYSGNKPIYLMVLVRFESLSAKIQLTDTFKSMCGYTLKADDPRYDDKLEALEVLRLDPSNMVMDPEMYEEWRNPEAADAIIENKKLREENASKDDVIARANAEAEELRQKLAEATKTQE